MQFQLSFLVGLVSLWIISAAPLQEPQIYELENGETYYLKAQYCEIANEEIHMQGRCYSFSNDGETYSSATSPGPTLKAFSGTSFTIRLVNNFFNSVQDESAESCHNKYCGMDVTNLHTHGLHISSSQDDVLRDLLPRQTVTSNPSTTDYTYTIPEDHYPGIHWYHPHNHGSVSHQIHFGMFGALITEYPNDEKYKSDKKLYTGYNDASFSYKTNILIFSGVYAVETGLCDCSIDLTTMADVDINNAAGEGVGAYGRCAVHGKDCFHQYSACYEYCAFEGTRSTSGLEYDINIIGSNNDGDGIDQYIFVNGEYNPVLEISVGKFRRLQFINAMTQYYIHYQLPAQCDIYLLGYDGVFFDDDFPRNLGTYDNQLILSPGSRADLLIKCSAINVYQVYTISKPTGSVYDSDLDGLERAGSDADDGHKDLFTISVVADAGDEQTDLPSTIPEKPEYLKDLRTVTADNNCACNQFVGDVNCGSDECCIAYNSKTAFRVNGEEFTAADRYLTYLLQDKVYQFKLKTDRHVHHQHVYPFQLQEPLAGGFIGKAGDFFDTIGAEFETPIRIYTKDFSGYMVLHCHLLPHEDEGMMGIFYVLSDEGALPSQTYTQIPIDQCRPDLDNGQARSFIVPEPVTVEKVKGGKGGGGKKANALLFDFHPQGQNKLILILISIFIALTICNTVAIIYKHFIGRNVVRKKKYVAVIGEDIDEIEDL